MYIALENHADAVEQLGLAIEASAAVGAVAALRARVLLAASRVKTGDDSDASAELEGIADDSRPTSDADVTLLDGRKELNTAFYVTRDVKRAGSVLEEARGLSGA
ncbi:MAG: hypothetical protein AAF747_01995 [Planctomycetota bacterium]